MRRWLVISLGIVVVLIFGLSVAVRALFPPPIPEPPTPADAVADFHLNEIDLATSSAMLVSIDNRTDGPLVVDLTALGPAVAKGLRLFDPFRNEWKWFDAEGRSAIVALHATAPSAMGWPTETTLTIEPGQSGSVLLALDPDVRLGAINWVARLRRVPDRLIYVLDCELPLRDVSSGRNHTVRVTAKGEAAYLPRP